jgi:hypothetical protein
MLSLILLLAVSPGDFSYDPQGRHDPFVSQAPRPHWESLVQEVKLTGVVRTPPGNLALFEGVDGRSHVLAAGGRIRDGTVLAIDAGGVTLGKDDGTVFRLQVAR